MGKCSTLTTVELGKSMLNKLGIEVLNEGKYLVSLKSLRSPMQSLKNSSTVTKKFLQSIENSYNNDYFTLNSTQMFAILNVTETESSFLKVSKFLMRQLNLFEKNSKVFLNATPITDKKIETALSSATKKRIKLQITTNKDKIKVNELKESFMKFIDEQSECLCPIILTNNMLIELELKEQIFTCSVSLKDEQFVAINTNTLLNDLLNVEIETNDTFYELQSFESLQTKLFQLKTFDCNWFKSNLNEIMSHLNNNLFNEKTTQFNRNLVISGLKGSGKTTLCKYVCNLVSNKTYNGIYHYINCQQFMSKLNLKKSIFLKVLNILLFK